MTPDDVADGGRPGEDGRLGPRVGSFDGMGNAEPRPSPPRWALGLDVEPIWCECGGLSWVETPEAVPHRCPYCDEIIAVIPTPGPVPIVANAPDEARWPGPRALAWRAASALVRVVLLPLLMIYVFYRWILKT